MHTCRGKRQARQERSEAREARDILFGATRIGEDHVLERNVPHHSLQRAAHQVVARVNHHRPIGSLDDGHGSASRFCERCQGWFHLPQTLCSNPGTCPCVILSRTVWSRQEHCSHFCMLHVTRHLACCIQQPCKSAGSNIQTDRVADGSYWIANMAIIRSPPLKPHDSFVHSTVASRYRPRTRTRMSVIRACACPM